MKRWDVLGFGAAAVDDLLYLDRFPAPDEKLPVVDEVRAGGGLVATGLVAAARLGASTAYGAFLDTDELSRFTIAELEREGVDCAPVVIREGARPYHSVIIVDRQTGSRTILFSSRGVTPLPPEQVPPDIVAACGVLFVDSSIPGLALHLTRVAHSLRVPVLVDLERMDRDADLIMALMREVDHLVVGARFAHEVTGERDPAAAAEAMRRLGAPDRPACVVTAGERGSWYALPGADAAIHRPACHVTVVDTTGCGDVFHGAYAAGIARGESVARAVDIATAAAALKATKPGGRKGIPDLPTVERFLRERSTEVECKEHRS